MIAAKRTKRIGIFEIRLLKKQLKQLRDSDRIEIIASEHKDDGYGLAIRHYDSDTDKWLTLPLM